MFENERETRCAICSAGILLGIVFVLAQLPLLLLIVPVGILFIGIVADPEETHAVWYGMLNVFGIFDVSLLTDEEKANYTMKRHYFWFGEVAFAAVLAGVIAVPAGIWLFGKTGASLAFTGSAMLFLLLFVFLPKFIRQGMKADTEAVIEEFGKNEQVKKVFWAVFAGMAGLILAEAFDPETARQIAGLVAAAGK